MFDKVQESLKRSKDERQKKRLEKERLRLEEAAAEAARQHIKEAYKTRLNRFLFAK